MYRSLILALLLTVNQSLLFGVTEAAHLPDDAHPFGQVFMHEHTDHHEHGQVSAHHDHDTLGSHEYVSDQDHDSRHQHSVHFHLNLSAPYNLNLGYLRPETNPPDTFLALHSGRADSPPVPPPDR